MTADSAHPAHLVGAQPVTVVPPQGGWRHPQKPAALAVRRFREELGLAADRPVIMSGHQAELWHPGIAAKWFAMTALARAWGAQPVWVVVDQDSNDPTRLAYPSSDLQKRFMQVGKGVTGLVTGVRGPVPGERAPDDCAPVAHAGLTSMMAALARCERADSLAAQFTGAAVDLLGEHASGVHIVYASGLRRTALFAEFVRVMRADEGVIAAYNRAVRESGGAGGVRELVSDPVRGAEFPLWTITPSGSRRQTYANDAVDAESMLAPKALLMTALLRLAGCELFIHGLGGGVYDRITDRWLEFVRDVPAARGIVGESAPAPTCVVTATRYLNLDGTEGPTPEQAAHMSWAAHRAKFEPAMLGDKAASATKAATLSDIRSAATPQAKLAGYRALHAGLDAYRAAHAPLIAAVEQRAREARSAVRAASVRYDRTWPFPLYGPDAMDALARDVDDALKTYSTL